MFRNTNHKPHQDLDSGRNPLKTAGRFTLRQVYRVGFAFCKSRVLAEKISSSYTLRAVEFRMQGKEETEGRLIQKSEKIMGQFRLAKMDPDKKKVHLLTESLNALEQKSGKIYDFAFMARWRNKRLEELRSELALEYAAHDESLFSQGFFDEGLAAEIRELLSKWNEPKAPEEKDPMVAQFIGRKLMDRVIQLQEEGKYALAYRLDCWIDDWMARNR